jgi:hypothetical protein
VAGYCLLANGRFVGIACSDERWVSVEDGPCEPLATREDSREGAMIIMAKTCSADGGELVPPATEGAHPLCTENTTTLGIVVRDDGTRAACCRAP